MCSYRIAASNLHLSINQLHNVLIMPVRASVIGLLIFCYVRSQQQHVDYENSTVCGYLRIQGLTEVRKAVVDSDCVITVSAGFCESHISSRECCKVCEGDSLVSCSRREWLEALLNPVIAEILSLIFGLQSGNKLLPRPNLRLTLTLTLPLLWG